jgi:phosphoglycolate phosphatase-like HAD superfamily hydrolase
MQSLSLHFARVRRAHPDDQLLIVFDLDGTVVDQRHAVRRLLIEYDRLHDTDHFHGLEAAELEGQENHLGRVLAERGLPPSIRSNVLGWRSQPDSVGGIDRARPGILEVMRWFQLQPSTFVGLTTRRPPRLRDDTLRSLNRLGRELRAEFDVGLLQMNDDSASVVDSRVETLHVFARAGYRTFAVVDSEPAVIEALAHADDSGEILFLHARNPGDPVLAAPRAVEGHDFDFTALIGERDLPDQVTLVWHGVNDEDNLHQFLASRVSWGECDVRRDPWGRLVLRHDSFETTPWTHDERLLPLARAVDAFANHDRGIKIDLKDGPSILPEVVALLDEHRLASHRVWFNARIDVLGADGFRTLQ